MHVGNARYLSAADLPDTIPVFPLSGALLLPGAQLPLNVFEPRYLAMVDDVLKGNRIIGIIQPNEGRQGKEDDPPALYDVGCAGRITSFVETGDGRIMITLEGICRFRVDEELRVETPYRQVGIKPFLTDLEPEDDSSVDRDGLLETFRTYLDVNQMEADWENIGRASNSTLVNSLSALAPFGPAEKQALLEASDLRTRAETLIAITEIVLARESGEGGMLQ